MDAIPSNHRLAERTLIQLVERGEWEIDDQGRVWRTVIRTGLKSGGSHLVPCARRRVEKATPDGYLMVRAMIDGKRVCGEAHRLVWQHEHGDITDGQTVNHKNGLKDDNRPSNLELRSYSEQLSHAHRSGLLDQFGQKNPAAKLSDREVAQIRLAYDQGGHTMQSLADRFGVRVQHVSRLVRGQRRPKQGGPSFDTDRRHSVSARDPKTGRFLAPSREHSTYPTVAVS